MSARFLSRLTAAWQVTRAGLQLAAAGLRSAAAAVRFAIGRAVGRDENRALRIALLLTLVLLAICWAIYRIAPEWLGRSGVAAWPEPIDSPTAFDRASRGEILVFAAALANAASRDKTALMEEFHIGDADTASVRKVTTRLLGIMLDNYRIGRAACADGDLFCEPVADEDALLAAGRSFTGTLPEKFWPWHAGARTAGQKLAADIVRLAALFPQVSSEADLFSPIEHDGFELPDRHFLLSFDDGPTAEDGQTDRNLRMLRQLDLHALFFLVGEQLEARLAQEEAGALQQLYAGQCVGVHGWRHLSHATWKEWQSSIVRTDDLVRETFANQYRPWFRPPYGERRSDSGRFFARNNLGVALWNINSYDWMEGTTVDEVEQIVTRLMLIWRRGIILMHDTLPKVEAAVPWIVDRYRNAGIVWEDCRGGNGL